MARKQLTFLEERILSRLPPCRNDSVWSPSYTEYIKSLRVALRMTQAELAKRAQVTQPHLAAIENGKIDPQIKTLRRIFDALSCDLTVLPQPRADIRELLRNQARLIARDRLQRVVGAMAMEGQTTDAEVFESVLEKQIDELLQDPSQGLWKTKYE